jgi:hypothetical protein
MVGDEGALAISTKPLIITDRLITNYAQRRDEKFPNALDGRRGYFFD